MKIKGSYLAATLVAAGLGAWLLSGDLIVGGTVDADRADADAAGAEQAATPLFRVRVQDFTAGERAAVLPVRGRTEARSKVEVRVETGGMVAERMAAKGAVVAPGDPLCRIETGAREARLLQARAQLAQAEFDNDGATRLAKRGFGAEQRVQATKAALDAARAVVADAELELARTRVNAPIRGIVQDPVAEVGDMLSVGQTCATVVDTDPMLVIAQVSERDVGRLTVGMEAGVSVVTGAEAAGRVRYIAPSADQATRTFRVEVEVPNPEGALRDGVTARIAVPLPATPAHKLPSSALSLADNGEIGIKALGDDDTVAFLPVQLLGDDGDGVWVAGLPDTVTVVTVGHEYVAAGTQVEPVREQTAEGAP